MKIISGKDNPELDRAIATWVASQIDWVSAPQFPSTSIGVINDDADLVGAVVFHNYRPDCRSIEITSASTTPRWLTRRILHVIFGYPFDQLKVGRITASTPKRAASARQFLESFGFRLEGDLRRGFGTDDALVYGLLDDEWRRGRFCLYGQGLSRGQEQPHAAGGA